jgi:hypothetical protein
MTDLATRYLGLDLRSPLVASASPLSATADGVRRLADSGVGAVVLPSLFEEQLRQQAAGDAALASAGTDSFAESLSYFPAAASADGGPGRYLSLLKRAADAVDIPVIASLNGATTGGWTDYASALQDVGAAAIELNIYYLPGDPPPPAHFPVLLYDPFISGSDAEQRHVEILVTTGIWEGRRGGIRAAGLLGRARYPRAACPELITSWLSRVYSGPWGAISACRAVAMSHNMPVVATRTASAAVLPLASPATAAANATTPSTEAITRQARTARDCGPR